MKRLKKWYMNLSIRIKFLYGILGIMLVILLTASISQYISASKIVTEQTVKQSAGIIDELSVNMEHYFKMVQNSFEYIANNNTVQEELKSENPYKSDGTELYSYFSRAGQIRRLLLQGYRSVYMNDIQLLGYNGANHLLSNDRNLNEKIVDISCNMAEESKGSCIYLNASQNEGLIYMAKMVKDSLTMKPLGILRATIKINYLKKMTNSAQESLTAHIFLLDEKNKIIVENTTEEGFGNEEWLKEVKGNRGSFSLKKGGRAYTCVYQKNVETGFTVAGIIPMSFLQKTAKGLQKTALMLVIISVILCIFLAEILSKVITGPIENTGKAMKKFAGGDFTVRLPEDRTDEIGEMNKVFNHTIGEIESLLKQVVEMETVNKDMEFQTLQAQINPHFLYNVLDTINWMARKKGEENICRMITAISNLMRASISNKKSMVSIKEEMQYIQDYIYIQETRFGDKFASCIEINDELEGLLIPKMTIQTLVENAVVHGIENATWDCFLYISGERHGGTAVFLIKDNGVGISEEKLKLLTEQEKITDGDNERTHTHLGIYAVRKRLEYVYNGKADMTIISEIGRGTEVTLCIPMNEMRGIIVNGTSGNDIG